MRRRRLIVLLIALLAVIGASSFALGVSTRVNGTAARTAADYFRHWGNSDIESMRRLVADPPPDFLTRHLSFSEELRVKELALTPGPLKMTGEDTAEVPFAGIRTLSDFGDWPFEGTLRLAVRNRNWRVLWAPETLHPLLKGGGTLELMTVEGAATELVTAEGDPIPHNSYADAYLDRLKPSFEEFDDEVSTGLALVSRVPGQWVKELKVIRPKTKNERTTLSRAVQAAAARALDGVENAAIVALRPSTGEVLAVADRLEGSGGAFSTTYPPASTFKTIVAAALLESGLEPSSEVECPAYYTVPNHAERKNAGGFAIEGATTLEEAFAHSCNTTFIQQVHERLSGDELVAVAENWGFDDRTLHTGVGGHCGTIEPPENPDWLAEDTLGQGTVRATPLCMAMAAAAVQSGVWRSPRILSAKETRRIEDGEPFEPVKLDSRVAESLRVMMRAVVDRGTASGVGLPDDVAGKTGTAEGTGARDRAWFIGYRGDLAFSVFVLGGGSGRLGAVPIAARFVNGV